MNKKIAIIIGVIFILGLVAYFLINKSSAPNQVEIKNESQLAGDSNISPQSLKDLLLKNKPLKCEYKSEGATGSFYIADKKVRGDMNIPAEGKTIVTHMIVMDDVSYTWNDGAKTGFKIKADKNAIAEKNDSNPPVDQQSSVDVDKKIAYNCSSWSQDNSYFSLPAGIEFTDLNSTPPTTKTSTIEDKATKSNIVNDIDLTKCAACDSVPAASQAQCKTALGCK